MARRSSSGTEGISINDRWRDSQGNLKPLDHPERKWKRFRVKVRVPGSITYESEAFDLRADAKLWGQRHLSSLRSGLDVAGNADLASVASEYVKGLRTVTEDQPQVSEAYARHIELVAAGLVKAGIRDMKAATYPARAREWIAGLKPGWWAKLVDGKPPTGFRTTPITNTTRNRIVRELRTLGAYAMKTRRMLHNSALAVDSFRANKRLRPQFELDELRRLVSDDARESWNADQIQVASLLAQHKGSKRAVAAALSVNIATVYNRLNTVRDGGDPWWMPCVIMVYTGLRVSEAMHLRWQDIDWTGRRVRVRLQEVYQQKNDTERETPLQRELADILIPLAKPSGFIIESEAMRDAGSALRTNERAVARRDYAHGFKRYLDRIGIVRNADEGDRVPHSIRHGWVALMLATGASPSLVADWAGHSGDVQKLYRSQSDAYHRDGAGDWGREQITLRGTHSVNQTTVK